MGHFGSPVNWTKFWIFLENSGKNGSKRPVLPPAWNALNQEALRVHHVDPRRSVVPYYNITGHKDVKDYQRLLRDVRDCRLAGLILVGPVCTMSLCALPAGDVRRPGYRGTLRSGVGS